MENKLKDTLTEIAELYVNDRETGIKKLKNFLDETLEHDLNKIASDEKLSQEQKSVQHYLTIKLYSSLQDSLNTEEGFLNIWKACKEGFKIVSKLKR